MAATLVFMICIVDRFGRRPALLVGAVGAGIAMLYLTVYSEVSHSFDQLPPSDSGARTAVAMVYVIFYGFSWNGIPWIFASEVLPTRVRTIGMMCAVCVQWLAQFVIIYSLPHMVDTIRFGTFYFFGTCTAMAFMFAYVFVLETKGADLLFARDVSFYAGNARRNYKEALQTRSVIGIGSAKKGAVHIEGV